MRLLSTIGLGLLVVLATLTGAAAQSWRVYSPPGGRYSIDMPDTPEVETRPVTNNDGSKTTLVQAGVEVRGAYYQVTYLDYGPNLDAYKTIVTIRDRYAAMGTMHRKKPPYPGQPGIEVTVDRGDGVFINARALIVGSRAYTIVVTTKSADYAPNTQRFFNSFKPLPG